ncbi:MAG TPA: PPOX class F420-dependent oxidoreductase [Dehalococcoidia bacterium]|nr:PPOX class F420-dependent oxidoreductase [Dehalococcoidia bacterium]
MAAIPESARKVIESNRLAHMITLNRDGSPQVTCVWVGVDGDEVVMAHLSEHRKVRNMRRDARVAVSVETTNINANGLQEYLVIYGKARVVEGGAAQLLQTLAHRYIGGEIPLGPNPPAGYVTRITPERYGGVGPWTS